MKLLLFSRLWASLHSFPPLPLHMKQPLWFQAPWLVVVSKHVLSAHPVPLLGRLEGKSWGLTVLHVAYLSLLCLNFHIDTYDPNSSSNAPGNDLNPKSSLIGSK